MRWSFLIAPVFAGAICVSASAQTDEELIDAVAFVARGVEDGGRSGNSDPIVRRMSGRRIVYRINFPEAKGPEFEIYATSPTTCVFEVGALTGGKPAAEPIIYNLNKATRFEVVTSPSTQGALYGEVKLEGLSIRCAGQACQNADSWIVRNLIDKSVEGQKSIINRYSKAVDFIKRRCPGKPY